MKPKLSKAQMQLAIIKKKQCDAKALAIVEQLLEPDVEESWLVQNLNFINKSHMEDVIEERAIVKLCGYILCKNPLTCLITQTYHISTRKNKIYDVRKRKNFCSSICFTASNYLLAQMLTSPLWLREEENIPTFKFLPLENSFATPGDEIQFYDIDGNSSQESSHQNHENVNNSENVTDNTKGSNKIDENESTCFQNSNIEVSSILTQCSNNHVIPNLSKNKSEEQKQLNHKRSNTLHTMVVSVEEKVKGWITQDTLSLLCKKEDLENSIAKVTQRDKYLELCQKLSRVQLEKEQSQTQLSKNELKPLPNLSDLLEEGKKIKLKVHAFYKGEMVIDPTNKTLEETNSYSVLPLTETAPKALRRKILLDKLNKILPDLLQILGMGTGCPAFWYEFTSERKIIIKGLIDTLALSASNIVFKTTEWTLVGLIVIKMLSILDPQLKSLLRNKQVLIHTSMILTSYQLGQDHLEKMMIEITNNSNY